MTSWPRQVETPGLAGRPRRGLPVGLHGAALIAAIGLVLTLVLIRTSDSRAHVALSEKKDAATAGVDAHHANDGV